MSLIRTVDQIKQMYLERADAIDASSYEVYDLCLEIERLRAENATLRDALHALLVMESHIADGVSSHIDAGRAALAMSDEHC